VIAGFVGTLGVLGFAGYALMLPGEDPADLAATIRPAHVALAPLPIAEATPAVTREPPPARPAAEAPVAEDPRRQSAELTISSTPAGASVLLDGETVGQTPLTMTVERDGIERELRVELPGYRSERRAIVLDRSRAVDVSLRRVAGRKERPRPALDIKEGR
jgi:hypothetical protein